MPRTLPVFAAIVLMCGVADLSGAQDRVLPVVARTTPLVIEIHGTVVDDAGARVRGASVMAIGATLAMVRSDETGDFSLRLPPGQYVLRATSDGYVSTYRESIDLTPDAPVASRRIMLQRSGSGVPKPAVLLASAGGVETASAPTTDAPPAIAGETPDQGTSETAWRLRHLPRTILRDGVGTLVPDDAPDAPWAGERTSPLQALAPGPAHAASAFLTETDFSGHVDFITTSSLGAGGIDALREWPRGVAYVVVGAPVGGRGDWAVRAAWTGGDFTSWTLVGDYQARPGQPHALRTGVSYSAQMLAADASQPLAQAFPSSRRVGGGYLSDRWRVAPGVDFDYGVRVERYDYLAAPNLVSGTVGARVAVAPRTALVLHAAPGMVAPGADQFLPPVTTGAWLPPERTFSSLEQGTPLRPELVERYDVLVETRLRDDENGPRVRVGRFTEFVDNQIATIFGLDTTRGPAHYVISSPGDARVDGWIVGAGGAMSKYVQAALDYRAVRALWAGADAGSPLSAAAPSAARRGEELSHDLTASLDADVPATATRINLSYRVNTRFSTPGTASPILAGRFKVEVRQQLPFQPISKGELNLLLSARTMLHELAEQGAYFDELLTVAPPMRVTCGLQMRF